MLSSIFARVGRGPQTQISPVACARQAIVAAGIGYATATLGYALVRPLLRQREGWLELVDDLEPWAYTPGPVIGALGAALGSSSLLGAGAAMAAAFGLRWGYRFLRPTTRPFAAPTDLTVMTFNTLAWQREGHDLAVSIEQACPDIVALQEIGPNGISYLTSTLADRYPYAYTTRSATSSGAALLSRYPLRDAVAFRMSDHGHWWQRAIVDTPFGPMTFFNVHTRIPYIHKTHRKFGRFHIPLAFRTERRRGEVRRLAEMLSKIDGPVIVVGDFNMTERSQDHRQVAGRLRDVYKSVGTGLGHTFPAWGSFPRMLPSPWPIVRLDYVWTSQHFSPVWAYRGNSGKSDHHPIIAGLRFETAADDRSIGSLPLAASTV